MPKFIMKAVANTDLTTAYLEDLRAPLDGMWTSFVGMGQCWTISISESVEDVIGYCVVNEQNQLLQFHVHQEIYRAEAFKFIMGELKLLGAFVSTIEHVYLSHCLDHHKHIKVNALMYHEGDASYEHEFPQGYEFTKLTQDMFEEAVAFGLDVLGCDPEWLKGYYSERIEKAELFGLHKKGVIIATGECRIRSDQPQYADVGMMVGEAYRKQGIATKILKNLRQECNFQGLRPICSTEFENVAAQTAIERSGFVSEHRILEIEF